MGQILRRKLILERLGDGGDHGSLAGGEERDEISESLSRAGAGLHHEMMWIIYRGGDALSHRLLTESSLGVFQISRGDLEEKRDVNHASAN